MIVISPGSGVPEWVEWVQALGPLVTLLAALLAAWIGWRTLRERRRADDKAEWWRRTQWALEAALSEDETRAELGVGMLNSLSVSPLASGDDLDVLIPAWDHLLDDIPPVPSGARVVVDEGGEDDGSA